MARVRFPDDAGLQPLWRSWQRVGLIIPRSWVRPPPEAFLIVTFALVAQLAALRSYEPMVEGSSPSSSRLGRSSISMGLLCNNVFFAMYSGMYELRSLILFILSGFLVAHR